MATLPHLQRPPAPHDLATGVEDFAPLVYGEDVDDVARSYRAPRRHWLSRYRAALLVTLACAALIAWTWLAWSPAFEGIADGARTLAGQDDGRVQLSATVGIVALGLLAWAATWARDTHPRRALRLSGGRGTIAVDALAGGLRALVLDVRDVREAEVRVENRGRGRVLMHAWVRVTPRARIDDALDAVDDAAEWLIEERLGLSLAELPLVDVRYDELDLRPRARPAQAPTEHTEEDA